MRLARVPWIAFAVGTAACGSGNSATPVSPGNVVLELTALLPRNNDVWLAPRDPDPTVAGDEGYAGDPEPVTIGCDLRLGVEATVTNYYLRPPDGCSGTPQCGYFAVDVDPNDGPSGAPAARAQAATSSAVLDLCGLRTATLPLAGPHVIRPELLLADGSPFTGPYAFDPKDVTVTFAEDTCDGQPDPCAAATSTP